MLRLAFDFTRAKQVLLLVDKDNIYLVVAFLVPENRNVCYRNVCYDFGAKVHMYVFENLSSIQHAEQIERDFIANAHVNAVSHDEAVGNVGYLAVPFFPAAHLK